MDSRFDGQDWVRFCLGWFFHIFSFFVTLGVCGYDTNTIAWDFDCDCDCGFLRDFLIHDLELVESCKAVRLD